MVFCFRDGHRLLMGKYIYSQNSPSTPAPPGPERGSMTRSNVNMPMPPEWFWKAPPDLALFPHPKSPSTATRLRPTTPKSKAVAIPQTVRITGFPPSPPLINGGEGRGEVVLIYSASVAVSGCDPRRLYFKKSRQIPPNQTKSSHPGPRPSPAVAITKPANRSTKSKRWNRFPLSPGERAGVRANVEPYLDQLPNSIANPAKSNQIKPSRNAPVPGRSHVQTLYRYDFTQPRPLPAPNPNGIPPQSPGLRGTELPWVSAPNVATTATRLRPTTPKSKAVAIPQTVRTTGFPPSPPLLNGGEGRGEVVLIYSASVAVSGCDPRRLYFKKSRQIRPNQTRSSHPGPRPSPAVAITKPANRSTKSKRWNRFPLSSGERAGVRASVEPYLDQLPISTANPTKSNQIKPSRNAPTPLISANHPVRLSITPFSGSIRPKTAVNRTKSNQFKPGLLTLLTRVSQTCPINTQSPTPRNSSLVNQPITLK